MQRVSTPKSGILVQNWPKNPILWQILLAEIRGWGFLIKNVLMRRYFIFARCLPPGSASIYFLSKNQVHNISGGGVVNFLTQDRNQKNVENWRVRVSYKNMFLWTDKKNLKMATWWQVPWVGDVKSSSSWGFRIGSYNDFSKREI